MQRRAALDCDDGAARAVHPRAHASQQHLKIDLVNDGPVTIVIDTDEWKK